MGYRSRRIGLQVAGNDPERMHELSIKKEDMIRFAIVLALIIGGMVGLFTRNLKKALIVGSASLIVGVFLSLLIVYSGIMGG